MQPNQSTAKIAVKANTEVLQRDIDNKFSKSSIWVESSNFYGVSKTTKKSDNFLIIGFDTEFKTPDAPLTRAEIADGQATYDVLSYQIFCSVQDVFQSEAPSWSGICYPAADKRLSLGDILTFAIWKGISTGAIERVPSLIYLAGHFTRADVPAFDDFNELTNVISSVRSTFTSIGKGVPVVFEWEDGSTAEVEVQLRDTMLLAPAGSKSLKALGELVGVEKLVLDTNPAKELFYKKNMDVLLKEKPDLFEKYAIKDAEICVRYIEQLIVQCAETIGERSVPATLSSIGVSLLLKKWKEDRLDKDDILGKEVVIERFYDKKRGHFRKVKKAVPLEGVNFYVGLATESYHGGRNEQFWFGPAFEDDWTDYDLSSAYPTAMAVIGKANWKAIRSSTRIADFTPTTLGVANVSFEFPAGVRFPTMPIRSDNGLVFPRKGTTNCGAPEIALAKALGAKLTIHHGAIIPTDAEKPVFGDFIRQCIEKRASYPKGSLQALFWKEVTNSTYGKTAQGLRTKRVYDLRERGTKPLPESRVTNAFFASFITSFVRAVLGEVINALPPSVCVFSCTTDGFLTNATQVQIDAAAAGQFGDLYRASRKKLTGESVMLEIKHQIRKPLGWRTRGQATLMVGAGDKVPAVVLAKGGIFTDNALDTTELQNDHIVGLFLHRQPTDQIQMIGLTGIRDIVERNADLVAKQWTKKLNMEFDWKRRPSAAWTDKTTGHVAFATEPWTSIDQFNAMRQYWEAFAIDSPRCLKSSEDFRALAVYVMAQSALGGDAKYLRRESPDINRLRQSLCAGWRQGCAGIDKTAVAKSADKFAALLSSVGIPCKRTDVENARKAFIPNYCPATPDTRAALKRLRKIIPSLDVECILAAKSGMDFVSALRRPMPFVAQTI